MLANATDGAKDRKLMWLDSGKITYRSFDRSKRLKTYSQITFAVDPIKGTTIQKGPAIWDGGNVN